MYNSNDVAERIREIAKLKNIIIKDMLNEIGLGKNTLMNFKNSMPKADNLAKIADYLDCSVDYLLGRTNVKEINQSTPHHRKFLPLPEPLTLPLVGAVKSDQPLTLTAGSYDMMEISAVSDGSKKISPRDFVVEIHGDSLIHANLFDGDYAVIHPCPSAVHGQIALTETRGQYEVQLYPPTDDSHIIGIFVCTCKGKVVG